MLNKITALIRGTGFISGGFTGSAVSPMKQEILRPREYWLGQGKITVTDSKTGEVIASGPVDSLRITHHQ